MSRARVLILALGVVLQTSCGTTASERTFTNDPSLRARLADLRASPPPPASSPKGIGGGPQAGSSEPAAALSELTSARCEYLARCAGPVDPGECRKNERAWVEAHVPCGDIDPEAAQTCVESLKTQSCDRVLEVTAGLPECMSLSLCAGP
jgi:hypothetical protein